jgi:hypothetical protein
VRTGTLLSAGAHQTHVQSIDVMRKGDQGGPVRVASSDSAGKVVLTTLSGATAQGGGVGGGDDDEESKEVSDRNDHGVKRRKLAVRAGGVAAVGSGAVAEGDDGVVSMRMTSEAKGNREHGWTGVALQEGSDHVYACSFWNKCVQQYDGAGGGCVRNSYTALNPTCIKPVKMPEGQDLLALCEANVVSLWDLRASQRGGCVQRLQTSEEELCCLDVSKDGMLATAGREKTVFVYDTRKMKMVGQWIRALKYEVMSLLFSSKDATQCYVTGLDHEVFCGSWVSGGSNLSTLKRHGFRGESRWIGMDRVHGSDTLLGLTENLHLYALRHPYRLMNDAQPMKRYTNNNPQHMHDHL